jgi:Flp pilus assembly protein TadD
MAETRKIAAILAADVVGFSPMTSADEDGTLARLRALRADNVRAYVVKSLYLGASRRSNEGLAAADEGLAINPNYARLYNAQAYAEDNLGRFDQAKSDIAQAMRLIYARPGNRLVADDFGRRRNGPRPFRRRDRPHPPGDR